MLSKNQLTKQMKLKVFIISILLVVLSLNVLAQKNDYDNAELFKMKRNANKILKNKVYRITSINERFEDDRDIPVSSVKYLREKDAAGRTRLIVESKTDNGIERTEYIRIGAELFVRENDGDWKILKGGSGSGSGAGFGSGPKIEYIIEKKFNPDAKLNGQKVSYFEKLTKYTFTYPNRIEKKNKTESYWFNNEGLLVKQFDEDNDITGKKIKRKTDLYEYDIELKIERPILKSEKN